MTIGIQAGRLLSTVTIEQLAGKTQSDTGAVTPGWAPVGEVPAEIKPLHGRNIEMALARTKGKSVSHQITIRHPGYEIEPVTCRISYEGKIFEIFSVVDEYDRHLVLDILANLVVA
jgi:SPP1 family predicted phage head-tail adaptor